MTEIKAQSPIPEGTRGGPAGPLSIFKGTIMNPSSIIRKAAASLGLDAQGFASLSSLSGAAPFLKAAGAVPFAPPPAERLSAESLLPGARSAIVILFPYKPLEEETGNIALYARAPDYHRVSRSYLRRLQEKIQPFFPDDQFLPITDTSPLPDRWLAYAAGLGFFGRNHCLIHPKYGSYVTIGALLTTLSLPGGTPMESRCGDCRRCLSACPGRALTEGAIRPWQCKSCLTQKKEALTEREIAILRKTPLIFGCDECQRVCPWNEKAAPSPLPEIREGRIPFLSREELESLSVRGFDKAYRGYAFAWRGKKVLLRNLALIEDVPEKD